MTDANAVLVRRPTGSDADRLGEINSVTWRHAYAGIVPADFLERFSPDLSRRRWHTNLASPRSGVSSLVAEVDGVVASYAIVGGYRTQQDAEPGEDATGWGEIYALYTHPDLQGRGCGQAVHDAALDGLRDRGFTTAALWVLEANEAGRRWYAARGWQPDGATTQWDGAGVPLDEVRLVRDLGDLRDESGVAG